MSRSKLNVVNNKTKKKMSSLLILWLIKICFCIACVYSGFVEEKVSSSSFSIKSNKSIKYVFLYPKSITKQSKCCNVVIFFSFFIYWIGWMNMYMKVIHFGRLMDNKKYVEHQCWLTGDKAMTMRRLRTFSFPCVVTALLLPLD